MRPKNRIDFTTVIVYGNRYMNETMNAVTREILLAFWKVHILHHAAEGSVYGQWMIDELRRHGYEISPGTLYPILQRMERHGWLKRQASRDKRLRARKNYTLTDRGRTVLHLLRKLVDEMHSEVVGRARRLPR
jgi:DNA-binding PadR family transcriptional regulator